LRWHWLKPVSIRGRFWEPKFNLGELEAHPRLIFFGEGASTVVLSIGVNDVARVEKLFAGRGLEFAVIGKVTVGPGLKIDSAIDEDVAELQRIYEDAIPRRLRSGD